MGIFDNRKLGLCYQMPKELLNSTREVAYEARMRQLTNEITEIERRTEELLASMAPRPIGRE
ncbi:MAG: hypothetical protein HZA36_02950 [Parcubacteria group bacterium]|nr:hypothetical protein [Parcubacteria group bacterium]